MLIPWASRVLQRWAYALRTTYQGDVTERVKLPEALSTLPKSHTGIMGALEDRESVSKPIAAHPQSLPPHLTSPTCGHQVCIEQGGYG